MTVRSDLVGRASQLLGDSGNAIFTTTEMNKYFTGAVKSLYPTYWKYETATTTAGAGPLQTMPSGARNLYYIGEQKATATRVRLIRQWKEGTTTTFVPKVNITGETLVWAWTAGFTDPADDVTTLDMNAECEEVVVTKMCISAMERIASSRTEQLKYFALTVREGVTEQDVIAILDAYHATLDNLLKQAVPRPARVG